MKTLPVLLTLLWSLQTVAQSLSADGIIAKSEALTRRSEKLSENLSGTLRTSVNFASSVLGKHSTASAVYKVTVSDGLDQRNELVEKKEGSDSSFTKYLARESDRRLDKPAFRTFESAFPWERYLDHGTSKREFSSEIVSDTSVISGRRCYQIRFDLDTEGDSLSAEGEGTIWIDAVTFLPVKEYHDISVRSTRGRAEVITSSDFSEIKNQLPVLVRSEIQTMPKFLFVKIGTIKIVIEQSDFNLE